MTLSGVQGEASNEHWTASAGVKTLQRMARVDRYNDWVARVLRPYLGRRILEVGCGIGNMTPYLLDAERVTCIDVLPESVAHAQEQVAHLPHVATLLALAHRWEAETGGSLPDFLDTVVLTDDEVPTPAAAQVLGLTLHAAKGLEFDTVVIVGAEDGLMPHYRHTAAETLAEERRLCYVGMTRARERLVFSVARMRRLWGDVAFRPPSRFLREAGLAVAPATPRGAGTSAGVSLS